MVSRPIPSKSTSPQPTSAVRRNPSSSAPWETPPSLVTRPSHLPQVKLIKSPSNGTRPHSQRESTSSQPRPPKSQERQTCQTTRSLDQTSQSSSRATSTVTAKSTLSISPLSEPRSALQTDPLPTNPRQT